MLLHHSPIDRGESRADRVPENRAAIRRGETESLDRPLGLARVTHDSFLLVIRPLHSPTLPPDQTKREPQ